MPHGWQCICFDIGRNGCHRTSSFFLFAVCVEANRMAPGRSWKSRHFVVGIVWILLVVDTSKVGMWNRLTRSSPQPQSARLSFASIDILSTKMIDLSRIIQAELLLLTPPISFVCECTMANQQWRLVMPFADLMLRND
jgi:hypothetical protein